MNTDVRVASQVIDAEWYYDAVIPTIATRRGGLIQYHPGEDFPTVFAFFSNIVDGTTPLPPQPPILAADASRES